VVEYCRALHRHPRLMGELRIQRAGGGRTTRARSRPTTLEAPATAAPAPAAARAPPASPPWAFRPGRGRTGAAPPARSRVKAGCAAAPARGMSSSRLTRVPALACDQDADDQRLREHQARPPPAPTSRPGPAAPSPLPPAAPSRRAARARPPDFPPGGGSASVPWAATRRPRPAPRLHEADEVKEAVDGEQGGEKESACRPTVQGDGQGPALRSPGLAAPSAQNSAASTPRLSLFSGKTRRTGLLPGPGLAAARGRRNRHENASR
jgi:hypothetical protein